MNEKWYCYRNKRTNQEIRVVATPGNKQLLKRIGLRLNGYSLMDVIDPNGVNKGAK